MGTQGEIIRAVLSYSHPAGSICQNAFTWELQDEDSSDAEILSAIDDWVDLSWVPGWDLFADSDVILYLVEVDVLTGAGLVLRNIGEALHADAGTVAGDVMPAAVSGFLQADSERAKSYGRKYPPGVSESHATEGILSPAALGFLVTMLAATVLDIDVGIAGILAPGILSRVTSAFLEFTGGGYATDVPAYQRRRKPGVGS